MRLIALLLSLMLLPWGAEAQTAAHPSLWHVRGRHGDVWLFGSVHVLPPGIAWQTPEVTAAMDRADTYVFEVSEDAGAMALAQQMVAAHGFLPQGQSLRDMLDPASQAKFDHALASANLTLAQVNGERPWLAGLQLLFAQMARHDYGVQNGVDLHQMAEANKRHKQLRFLETLQQQFALLAPDDPKLELQEFESGLDDLDDAGDAVKPMIDAWAAGDQVALATLITGDMDKFPQARQALFDDRNARWVTQIAAMLREKHSFLITVGAGHLAGPDGVPALLRKAGYVVDGP